MSRSVSIEIGDTEYEVEVTYVDFGQEPKGWDPGAGAEIEIGEKITVWSYDDDRQAKRLGVISLDEFVDIFAEDRGIKKMSESNTRAAARAQLEEYCLENVRGQMEDDYDDSDV